MTKHEGGTKVRGGYYWNTKAWEFTTVDGDAGVLPRVEGKFIRTPTVIMIAVAVATSLSYAFFLPFIGFALAAYAVGKKLGLVGRRVAEAATATVAPAWRPGEAYFAEKPGEKKGEEAAPSESLDLLEKEIEQKRNERPN